MRSLPAWANFLGRSKFDAFMDTIEAELRKRGVSYKVLDDGRIDVGSTTLGLLTLAQMCAQSERASWEPIIGNHLDALTAAESMRLELDELAKDFDKVSPRLRVRLYGESYREAIDSGTVLARPFALGIWEVLVVDAP